MTGEKYTSVETLCATIAVLWGAFVLNPFVDSFQSNPKLFAPMQTLAPEAFWGAFYLTAGCLAWLCALKNRAAKAEWINIFVFISISVLFLFGDKTSYAWTIYLAMALWNFIHWRARKWNRHNG